MPMLIEVGAWFARLSVWAKLLGVVGGAIVMASGATTAVVSGWAYADLPRLVSEQNVDRKITRVRSDDIVPLVLAQAKIESYIAEQQLSDARKTLSELQKERADWEVRRPTFTSEQQPLVTRRMNELDGAIDNANDRVNALARAK